MNETYKNLRKIGHGHDEATARAKTIDAAKASPCQCGNVRHLPGDDRCPNSPTYTPSLKNKQW